MHRPVDHHRRIVNAALAAGAIGGIVAFGSAVAGPVPVRLQLGWVPGTNQAGDVVARRLGYYAAEGLDLRIQPGGPNFDGIASVVSGRCQYGQVSSSPSVMFAVSQGVPIRCFAVGAQRHPYCYFSLRRNPVRRPADLAGKRVGVQPTGAALLRAVLARHQIDPASVQVVPIGASMTPLLTGQVDVVTGWLTNTTALRVLGRDRVDLPLWDAGVQLHALPYYAHTDIVQHQPELLARFLRATARGWLHAEAHRDEAVDLLVREYPNLDRANERVALDAMLGYSFGGLAGSQGWGAMDRSSWQDQVDLYARLRMFPARVPRVDEVMTLDILAATRAARMKA